MVASSTRRISRSGQYLFAINADGGTLKPAPGHGRARGAIDIAAVALVGIGGSWHAGNIGPVVADVSHEFGISLTSVGLLSGAIFFTAVVVGLLLAPRVAEQLGLVKALALGAMLGGIGSIIFAVSGSFWPAAGGRILSGIGLGFAAGLGPVLARVTGGVGRVGVFGAGFQLGIALGLGVGSILVDAGIEWRVAIAITAAVAFTAVPFLLAEEVEVERREPAKGFYGLAVRSPEAWRLSLLFMAMFSVPLTLGAWFVHYLTVDGSLTTTTAGVYAFLLFALSAALRQLGGNLAKRGVPARVLTGITPLLATIGLVAIGASTNSGIVLVAVILIAAGFALPYAQMMIEAQRLFPEEPARPTSALTMISNVIAIPMVPVLGALLAAGEGELGFVLLGVLVLAAGLFNLKPVLRPLREPAPGDASA